MTRFLADENISPVVVQKLRSLGHDVLFVVESMRGASDAVILRRTRAEGRVLVTWDKDFGQLFADSRVAAPCGLVLFRLSGANAAKDIARIVEVLQSREDWTGLVCIATESRVRLRTLPIAPRK